jgi:hypothetical protein
MRRIQAVVLVLVAVMASAKPCLSQGCDASFHSSASDPYGYRARGDRCEGVYIRDLSASLRVVSFTREFDAFTGGDPILHLKWAGGASREVHLRASGLRPRLYYEMDSVQPGGSIGYDWETSLLSALGITRPELGIVGWTSQQIGGQDRQVYLPLAVTTSKPQKKSSSYQFIVVSGVELHELYVSLSLLDKDGARVATLRKEEPLKAAYYPAEAGIPISLPELKKAGLYLLTLGAEFQRGGVSTETVWFRYDD